MPDLAIYLLGAPHLERQGQPVTVQRRKALALIAYLAVTERAHSRDELATLLWPEWEPVQARTALRRVLVALKQAVGPAALAVDGEHIALAKAAPLWIDVQEFQRLLAQSQQHPHPSLPRCELCLAALQEAVALYQGDFLAGFSLADAPAFGEWQTFEAESLRRSLSTALEQLAFAHAARHDFAQAIALGRRWLHLDPLHEPAHRALMHFHAWAGDSAAALRQYETCVDALAQELGVVPGPETRALHAALLAGTLPPPALEGSTASTVPPPGPPASAPALPQPLTRLVGRRQELATLAALLADGHSRLVTITGPGGMGKTHLALSAARAQLDLFDGAVYFVPLAALETPAALAPTILEALGGPLPGDPRPPRRQLCDILRTRKALLVLDNFEHLLEGVALLVELLQAAPQVHLLVTARQRLGLSAETVLVLEGLDYPAEEHDGNKGDSSTDLFVQSARRLQPDFAPDTANRQAIARIGRLAGGMPLALVLAAGWMNVLSPPQIAGELAHSLDLLESDLHDIAPRQRSMAAIFEQTWRLLGETEQDVFMKLSLFRGGFTYEGARAVAAATPALLARLANKGLLLRASDGRYDLHPLLHRFAAARLAASPQQESAAAAHAAYYLTLLAQTEAAFFGSNSEAPLQSLAPERENVLLAWRQALALRQTTLLAPAVEVVAHLFLIGGRFTEGEEIMRLAVESLSASSEPLAVARCLAWQCLFGAELGQTEQPYVLYRQSLQILEGLAVAGVDVRRERAFCLVDLTAVLWSMDLTSAVNLLEEGLALCREIDDRGRTARALRELARVHILLGNFRRAHGLAGESLAIRRSLGDRRGMAQALSVLCSSAYYLGQTEQSRAYARACLALGREMGSPSMISQGLLHVGSIDIMCGEYEAAPNALAEARSLAVSLGMRQRTNTIDLWSVLNSLHLGEYEEARRLGQACLAVAEADAVKGHRAGALYRLGLVALVEGDGAAAADHLTASASIFHEVVSPNGEMMARVGMGHAALLNGDPVSARRCLQETLAWGIAHEDRYLLFWLLALAARLFMVTGEATKAALYYTGATRDPAVARSRWFHDVAGAALANLVASLPPAAAAAVQEDARAQDLRTMAANLLAMLAV